jgi:hypothetical protein
VLHSDVMFAKPLPLFSAFLGGCLCTAAVIGFGSSDRKPRAVTPSERPANVFVATLETEPEIEPEIQPPSPPPKVAEDAGSVEEMGSSVADVLARLETAYRSVSPEKTTEPTSVAPVATNLVPAPIATPEPSAAPEPSATASSAVALPEAAPAKPAVTEPAVATQPAAVAEPAPLTYVAEVHQDIHVGDVHQGDRYEIEQLAVLQYLQLLALSSYAGLSVPPARALPPGRTPRVRQTPRPGFSITSIPNPDNPWGFNFPPPALVK